MVETSYALIAGGTADGTYSGGSTPSNAGIIIRDGGVYQMAGEGFGGGSVTLYCKPNRLTTFTGRPGTSNSLVISAANPSVRFSLAIGDSVYAVLSGSAAANCNVALNRES